MSKVNALAPLLIAWQTEHGRHHLPWQVSDPYRVWLSEIMLQQTQVATVLGYFPRFLERFPNVEALANAPQSDVLALWSGLGYYARARNLHRAAQMVCTDWGGRFPPNASTLQTLPGVGRSTANAIAAFCYQERVAILDANVKRVLSRYAAFGEDLALKSNEIALWNIASATLPSAAGDMPAYTQGLMDLGATLCLPRRPKCAACPLQTHCKAAKAGESERYPVKTRKLLRKSMTLHLLFVVTDETQNANVQILLQQRAQSGIWAGLFAPPTFESATEMNAFAASLHTNIEIEPLPAISHQLTHRDMQLLPSRLTLPNAGYNTILSNAEENAPVPQWFNPQDAFALGLPAPIRTLLHTLLLTP